MPSEFPRSRRAPIPDEFVPLAELAREQFDLASADDPDASRHEEALLALARDLVLRLRDRGVPAEQALVALKHALGAADDGATGRFTPRATRTPLAAKRAQQLTDRVVRESIVAYYQAPPTVDTNP